MDIVEFAERMQAAYDQHKQAEADRELGQLAEARAARNAGKRAMAGEAHQRAHERRRAALAAGQVRPALVLPGGRVFARLQNTRTQFW